MGCKCKEREQRDTYVIHEKMPDATASTRPNEPCLYCAEKHIATAAALARELGYSDVNRGYIVGELVAACWHLYGHSAGARELSDRLREFRHRIQTRQEDESSADWEPYLRRIGELIEEDGKGESQVDIIIPLGPGTCSGNDELRLFLRSLEANGSGYGVIWLVTDCPPDWLAPGPTLRVLPFQDHYRHNKDANLFEKIMAGLEATKATNIVWTCDDCAILKPVDLSALPPIYGNRTLADFRAQDYKWAKRMVVTLEELGMEDFHWDAHVPQRWNVEAAKAAIRETPYGRDEGRCVNTAVMGRMYGGKLPASAVVQTKVKETAEKDGDVVTMDKIFVGYNDKGFLSGVREWLFTLFREPSKWEKLAP